MLVNFSKTRNLWNVRLREVLFDVNITFHRLCEKDNKKSSKIHVAQMTVILNDPSFIFVFFPYYCLCGFNMVFVSLSELNTICVKIPQGKVWNFSKTVKVP